MYKLARGFTLPEALTVTAVIAVLLGLGIPGWQAFARSQDGKSALNTLAGHLILARSESIKRSRPVLIDNVDGSWNSGWTLYVDANDNALLDVGDPVLTRIEPQPEGLVISGNTPVRRYVRYIPSGQTQLLGGGFQAGTLTICHASGLQPVRKLVISASGRARVSREAPGPC